MLTEVANENIAGDIIEPSARGGQHYAGEGETIYHHKNSQIDVRMKMYVREKMINEGLNAEKIYMIYR